MFVKIYSYKIKKKYLPKWKNIQRSAKTIYRKHGDPVKWTYLLDRKEEFVTIIEISSYLSKKDFLKIKKEVDNDKEIGKLFNKFLEIVYKNKIVEKGFILKI